MCSDSECLTIDLPANVEDVPELLDSIGLKMAVPMERTVCNVVDGNFYSSELERVLLKSPIGVVSMDDSDLELQEDAELSANCKVRQYILVIYRLTLLTEWHSLSNITN
jgi:hypothetical protein